MFKVCVEDFNRIVRKQKSRKDSGPDGISSACLNVCADQPAPVFTQIFNRLELNTLKTLEIIVDFRRNPTHHHGQHCDCSGVIQIPENPHLSGPEVGQSHWLYCEKGPVEAVFPPPAKEVQPATGAAETVLLCHHRVCPVFIYNCLVWFRYQNRHQKTTTDSQTAERIIGAPLPSLQDLYTSRVRKRAKKVTLDSSHPVLSLFELLPSGHRYRSLSTKTARNKNSFSPPGHVPPEQHITHPSTIHL